MSNPNKHMNSSDNQSQSNILIVGKVPQILDRTLPETWTTQRVATLQQADTHLSVDNNIDMTFLSPDILQQHPLATLQSFQNDNNMPCIGLSDDEQTVEEYINSELLTCFHLDEITERTLTRWFGHARKSKRYHEEWVNLQQTQLQLAQSKHLIDSIFMTMTDAVNVFDVTNDTHLYGNHRIAKNLGYSQEEIAEMDGDNMMKLIHPDDLDLYESVRASVRSSKDGEITSMQVRMKSKAGSCCWIQSDYLVFQRDNDGNVVEILGVARDITDVKSIEQHLTNALEKEIQLREQKNKFIRTTSHEFRTPLTVILSCAETLHRYYDRLSEEKRDKKYQGIYTQVHHMTGMLDDLLSIVQMERGEGQFPNESVYLNQFTQQVIDEFELAHELSQRIQLSTDQPDTNVLIKETLFRQVLWNLLSNAYKYTFDDSPIEVTIESNNNSIILTVKDFGIGISENDLPYIFNSFYRGDNINEVQGTGLGMYIIEQSLKLYDGKIDVASVQGEGTTITVTLPKL